MMILRRANDRGQADFGWLKSRHSFSFGDYYDKEHMGFSALRVINDDRVAAGAGFQTHGHRDMEIISYVLSGEIAHKDSEQNSEILPAGEFQLMSAGSGIRHSEFNPSPSEALHFLQIWIQPNVYGQAPSYQQKDFGRAQGLTLVISPDGETGSLRIKQDARIYQLFLAANSAAQLPLAIKRKSYVHVVTGQLTLEEQVLSDGDGAMLDDITVLSLTGNNTAVLALVFDLPE
jgi:hypothetical protein